MIVIGLTGSIGMGKSAVAGMFRDLGLPVFDADAEVHRLYETGGAAVPAIARRFASAVVDDAVDREALSRAVLGDKAALKALEKIVHPLVREAEENFLARARDAGGRYAVLEIPLLFEVGAGSRVDIIIVVSAPSAVQRQRVLQRPGMNAEKLGAILERQVPDAEKRARADFVIDTGVSLEETRRQVAAVIAELGARQDGLKKGGADARNRA